MKILQIHNKYRYFGGEDSVVDEEAKLLRSHNHEVNQLIRENSEELISFQDKLSALKNISYSHKSVEILNKEFLKFGNPDIVHVHNTFPLWTYSVFEFFNKKNVPIILTLHNYRLIWEMLGLFNKDREKYGYFKESNIGSFIISKLINKRKDLLKNVTKFITHTEFTKQEFSRYVIPENKLMIKPNFLNPTDKTIQPISEKNNAVFASRLSKEKGILSLIKAFEKIDINLDILGDGPLFNKIKKKKINNIILHGNLPRTETNEFINKSKFIVVPSECYESFPMTILEAFREGTLILASNIGSIKSIINDRFNGILFEPGNTSDLIDKVKWILNNQKECDQIALNANNEFKKKYSSEINYKQLIDVYEEAIKDNES
jgi:glycosyltransferase involved in cell wall biosynthesis|tara:strand:+ start:12981 stop:14105 length:1125 start_codon:yes stop_codon:yes gene_type:complete